MRPFYLHPRNGIIYAQFVDPQTKKLLPARSTKKTSRDEALLVVYDWLKNGIPQKKNTPPREIKEKLTVAQILLVSCPIRITLCWFLQFFVRQRIAEEIYLTICVGQDTSP
jgi:hypothetical protein